MITSGIAKYCNSNKIIIFYFFKGTHFRNIANYGLNLLFKYHLFVKLFIFFYIIYTLIRLSLSETLENTEMEKCYGKLMGYDFDCIKIKEQKMCTKLIGYFNLLCRNSEVYI